MSTGVDLIGAFDAFAPHVLLCDPGLPGEDGAFVIRKMRESGRGGERGGTPVVAPTANASVEDRDRALTPGFAPHVANPIDPASLVSRLAGDRAP